MQTHAIEQGLFGFLFDLLRMPFFYWRRRRARAKAAERAG